MNASDQLHQAYQEWRQLADAEGQAIRESNWTRVASCQHSLRDLQPQIIRWTQEARAEWQQQGRDLSSEENRLRAIIGELIEIERRNSAWLNDVRQTAQAQISELEQSGQKLRQVQRSYSPTRAPAWSSFS